jgi:MFS family permease
MRGIAGNGSVRLGGIYMPFLPIVGRKRTDDGLVTLSAKPQGVNPFVIFSFPDVLITLAFTGIVYAVNYTITATISSSFAEIYPWLSETVLGLCYLPTGFGMIVGSTLTGKLLDREYAKIKERHSQQVDTDAPFPKEYARLRTMPLHLVVFVICVVAWGFCIQHKAHIAVPLILQVICESQEATVWPLRRLSADLAVGWTSIAILNTTMTLMIDILQKQSSSATACVSYSTMSNRASR